MEPCPARLAGRHVWLALALTLIAALTIPASAHAATATLVKDISPGGSSFPAGVPGSGYRGNFTNVGGTAYFAAYGPDEESRELWKSDGTAAGTTLVENINPFNSNGSFPLGLRNVAGTLFFSADDGTHGRELWKSNGTEAGTKLVEDIRPDARVGSIPQQLVDVGATLFFVANDDTHGRELWKSDGTAAGTTLVKDINPGADSARPLYLRKVAGTLFFQADDGTHGIELWKSNGTAAGTSLVEDIRPGLPDSYPDHLTNVAGTLFFSANDGTHGDELWKSDGTAAGTSLVKDINVPGLLGGESSYPAFGRNVAGTFFFHASDGGLHGIELWKSDGTEAGTTLVKDINPGDESSAGRFPGNSMLMNVGATAFLFADDGFDAHGIELWRSNGTETGTSLVQDIDPGGHGSSFSTLHNPTLMNVRGTLFLAARDGSTHGTELWSSDGTEAGTTLVEDIRPGNFPSNPSEFTNVAGTLFFQADDGTHGIELWKAVP